MIAGHPTTNAYGPSKSRSFVDISQDTMPSLDPFQYSQYVPLQGAHGSWSSKDVSKFNQYHFREVEPKKVIKSKNGFRQDSIFFDINDIEVDDDPFLEPPLPRSDSSNPTRSKNDIFNTPLAPTIPFIKSAKSRNSIFDVPTSGGPLLKPPPRLNNTKNNQPKKTPFNSNQQKCIEDSNEHSLQTLSVAPPPSSSSSSSSSSLSSLSLTSSQSHTESIPPSPKNASFFDSTDKRAPPPPVSLSRPKKFLPNTQLSMDFFPKNFSPTSFSSPPLSQLLTSYSQSSSSQILPHLFRPHEINLVLLPTRKNLLGVGRHARVFKATYTTSQQPIPKICAAKRLNAQSESQFLGLSEAYILRKLTGLAGQHENIVKLIGVKDEASFDAPLRQMDRIVSSHHIAHQSVSTSAKEDYNHLAHESGKANEPSNLTNSQSKNIETMSFPISPPSSEPDSPADIDRTPCLVLLLEYCANGSLWDWVQENKSKIGRRLWMKWARQLSSAIERVHAVGLVHHDVKPHNVLLTEMLDIKLSDFGTAVFTNTTVLEDGLGKGTPPYSPPELLAMPPHPYSYPVDIFSLGVTLYVIGITGEEPFRMVRSPVELLVWVRKGGFWEWEERIRHITSSSERVSSEIVRFLNGEPVPTEILELLKHMTNADPAARPTATEVVARLRELDGGGNDFQGGLSWSGFDTEKKGDQSLFGTEDGGTEGERVDVDTLMS